MARTKARQNASVSRTWFLAKGGRIYSGGSKVPNDWYLWCEEGDVAWRLRVDYEAKANRGKTDANV
jgi:hypothetical protein